ncbi:phosphotriesterase family protein [Glaciibacter superstes]|uniref:phosphotriesterase family protein n=1 Tax=Glaciibacter superstes TaxID=501023 RepID=UPI0003B55D59|nr:aryldialkylphosphatase [Glaciibacter superstes]
MTIVRTVLGDIEPSQLGVLDYHEHLFQVSPLLPGDELDNEAASGQEAELLFRDGVTAMIEATPTSLGRNVEAVARISASTGLAVVHATGAHHSGHYSDDDPLRGSSVDRLVQLFTSDVERGLRLTDGSPARTPDGDPIRAGILKAGIRYWHIGPFEQRVLEAAASAHLSTGAPIMVHLDYGSASHEVLDILAGFGVDSTRVVLAHVDRNLDAGLHISLAERGAYLGYDGMARHREAPDSAIIDCLVACVDGGAGSRIVLGGDVARASRYLSYGGMPGLSYLPLRFVPRLVTRIGASDCTRILVENGARLLSM